MKDEKSLLSKWQAIRSGILASDRGLCWKVFPQIPVDVGESVYKIAKDAQIDYQATLKLLKKLEKLGVVRCQEGWRGKVKRYEYVWTYQGVMMFPEMASSPGVASILERMFGKYEEMLNFLSLNLLVPPKAAKVVLDDLLLPHARYFLTWLRVYAFPIDGLKDLDDVEYFREQSLNFLLAFVFMPIQVEWVKGKPENAWAITDVARRLFNARLRLIEKKLKDIPGAQLRVPKEKGYIT